MKPMVKRSAKKGAKFFDDFIRTSGPNFMETESIVTITRKLPVLCRDIACGNVDINKYGKYFTMDLVTILYHYVEEQYIRAEHSFGAMKMYANAVGYGNSVVQVLYKEALDRYRGYSALYESIQRLYFTGDLSNIDIAASNTKNYRFLI